MTPKQLYKGAVKEASKLRIHLTQEEKESLDFETLDAGKPILCIYGQATGSCWSERADYLISKCASKIRSFSRLDCIASEEGKPRLTNDNFTFLEVCIFQHPQYNRHFIDFIKGNIDAMPEWGSLEGGGE